MISITSFSLILSILAGVLVGAIPQHQQRDGPICIDKTTITVTAPAAADPTTPPDAVVTVVKTVTVVRTVDSVLEQTSNDGVTETVTVFSTETSTVTVQPPLETQISDLTTGPEGTPSPRPVAPLPPIVQPHFGNATQPVPYSNSSLPSSNSSSSLPYIPVLPKPSSTVGTEPSSGFSLPISSGYENSLYFANWSVTQCPFFVYMCIYVHIKSQTDFNQGNIWSELSATVHTCLQDHSCVLCVRLIWK